MLPRICFSTLACPHWSVETVIQSARAFGYDGIEWRGGDSGHINPDASPEVRRNLRDQMRDANLEALAVTSYTSFVSDDPAVRGANVDDLKRYLDLAADLNARFVRVFLGELEPGQTQARVRPYIVEGLQACVADATSRYVGIAIENHDDFVETSALVPLLAEILDPAVGAIWDIGNAYSEGERVEQGAENLRGRISYVQVKDGTGQKAQWRLTDVGQGEVQLRRAVELLREQKYAGAFSVEWEYADHPELEPPERALPQALKYMRKLLAE